MDCAMFEGDRVAGPVMSLYGEDPVASKGAIDRNPAFAYKDYQRIVRSFLMPELVDADEAMSLVKKPK